MITVKERPTIKLKSIEFDLVKEGNENTKIKEFSKDIGRTPYVEIGKLCIETNSMIQMQLFNDQFLPRIFIQFRDTSGQLIDPLFPIDNTILKVFIQPDSDTLMPIRMDFKITEINPIKSKGGDNYDIIFGLHGILDVDYLYKTSFTSTNDTSYNVIKSISVESGLGFASNIDNTDDKMVWINPSEQYMEYIQNIIKYSYKSQNSFMVSYIDFYYNLNYIDIETALNEDINGQMEMVGNNYYFDTKTEQDEITELILTNHPDKSSTNTYINKYNLVNKSTAVNLKIGYISYTTYYETDGNVLYKLILDNISTNGDDNKNIIMKGGIGEVSESLKDSAGIIYAGKQNNDNMHSYYLYAGEHNKNNLKFLQKVKLKITLSKANFNLYRFQKVNVKFFKTSQLDENDIIIQKTNPLTKKYVEEKAGIIDETKKLNERLSGDWLITSINYTYNKQSGFEQDVSLVKRELRFNENDFDSNKTY